MSVGETDDAVGVGGEILIVGDDDESMAHVAAQIEEKAVELGAVTAVETACRLVGEHYTRIVDQRTRHGSPLALTAAELRRLVGRPVAKSEIFYQLHGTAPRLCTTASADESRHLDILEQRELRQQLMELKHESDALIATRCRRARATPRSGAE